MKKLSIWMWAMVALWLIMISVFLVLAPDQVPVHFDINGAVDRWGSKYEYLLLTALGIFTTIMPVYGEKLGLKKVWRENGKVGNFTFVATSVVFMLLFGYLMWMALDPETLAGGIDQLSMKGGVILLMVLFILLGNIMPKARRNSGFGLRILWSNYNDTCWQKSQRVSGFAMMVAGVLGLALCIFLPDTLALVVPLVLTGVMLMVSIIASYCIYRKEISKE